MIRDFTVEIFGQNWKKVLSKNTQGKFIERIINDVT